MKNSTAFFVLFSLTLISIMGSVWMFVKYKSAYSQIKHVEEMLLIRETLRNSTDIAQSDSLKQKIVELSQQLEVKEIKGGYFLDQLGILSDWFLGVITIILAVVAILGLKGFQSVEEKVEEMGKQIQVQEKRSKKVFDIFAKRFEAAELDYYNTMSVIHSSTADLHYLQKNWPFVISSNIMFLVNFLKGSHPIQLAGEPKSIVEMRIDMINEAIDSLGKDYFFSQGAINDQNKFIVEIIQNVRNEEIKNKIMKMWIKLEQYIQESTAVPTDPSTTREMPK